MWTMWFYLDHVLIPYQAAEAAQAQRPRGNLSDLYPRWLGTRELLLHRRDPYSAEITREIQAGYYGRPIDPSRPNDPHDKQAFAYPVYVAFLLAPTVRFPFHSVQIVFNWTLWFLTAASVLLWARLMDWRPTIGVLTITTALVLGSPPAMQGIRMQQLTMLVSGMIACAAFALYSRAFAAAGVLVALATIKPQLVALLIPWLLLWAATDWARRKRFALAFAGSMGLLLAGAQWLLPGWLLRFWHGVLDYREYTRAQSLLESFVGSAPGKLGNLALLVVVAMICWRSRQFPPAHRAFESCLALVLAATSMLVPMNTLYNQVLLLPAIVYLLRERPWIAGRWPIKVASGLAGGALVWPYVASIGLFFASFLVSQDALQNGWKLPLLTAFAIPLTVVSALALNVWEVANGYARESGSAGPPALEAAAAKSLPG